MEERYSRNRIYVTEEEQAKLKSYKILLGGAGIGSIIAESSLRFGFENITIIDGDRVETSNLNRQNYTTEDIGKYKAESLAKRLLSINPNANIQYYNEFVDHDNVKSLIDGHNVAINALDFKDDIPFVFDKVCKTNKIPVLHPYNFGWAGFLTIASPDSYAISDLSDNPIGFELRVADYVINHGIFWNKPKAWLEDVVNRYREESKQLPPPQLAIASWIVAGYCVNAMYNLATGKDVKYFPEFYLSSLLL